MNEINKIVIDCLREHEGGEKFFDALDEKVRNSENILNNLCNRINQYVKRKGIDYIICSGKFGRVFSTYYNEKFSIYIDHYCSLIVVNGGLRKGNKIDDFEKYIDSADWDYIFVDDSFYSGTTRNVIKSKIEECKGILHRTFVIYDGSKEKDESVESMYRYYE